MDDKQIDELIRKALSDESTLPEGIADRLNKVIDEHAAGHVEETRKAKHIRLFAHSNLYWISGAAASIAVCIGLFFIIQSQQQEIQADTFKDPQQAERVAEKALAMVSTKVNMGAESIDHVDAAINKAQTIIEEKLYDNYDENN